MVKIYLSIFFSIISIFYNDPDTIIFKSIENYLEADIENTLAFVFWPEETPKFEDLDMVAFINELKRQLENLIE